MHHAAELLECANDKDVLALEVEVPNVTWTRDIGSERNNKVVRRQQELAASENTFESRVGAAMEPPVRICLQLGLFGGAANILRQHCHRYYKSIHVS